jgi:hypothetical protein
MRVNTEDQRRRPWGDILETPGSMMSSICDIKFLADGSS